MIRNGLKNRWYAVSVCAGLLPLLTGCGIYVAWLASRNEELVFTGLLLAPFCLLVLLAGFACLIPAGVSFKRNNEPRRKQKILRALAILFINFPVAAFMMLHADNYYSMSVVKIVNNTDTVVNDIVITDPRGNILTLPDIAPRSKLTHRAAFKGEGKVTYRLSSSKGPQNGVLIGYISALMRAPGASLEIDADGDVKAEEFMPALAGPY